MEGSRRRPAGQPFEHTEFLNRSQLRDLGLERRAIDAVFRGCRIVAIPGYSRPLIHRADFEAFLAEHTYDGSRVRP
jgi:hypothetical protein